MGLNNMRHHWARGTRTRTGIIESVIDFIYNDYLHNFVVVAKQAIKKPLTCHAN